MKMILNNKLLSILVLVIGVIVLVAVGFFLTAGTSSAKLRTLTISGDSSVQVELATTEAQQAKGLGGRKSLPADQGMLFLFTDYTVKKFWMKDLSFPLDLIWIYDGKIVGIEKNLPPAGFNPEVSYDSPGPVNMVLEVNGGWAETNEIKIGDVIMVK